MANPHNPAPDFSIGLDSMTANCSSSQPGNRANCLGAVMLWVILAVLSIIILGPFFFALICPTPSVKYSIALPRLYRRWQNRHNPDYVPDHLTEYQGSTTDPELGTIPEETITNTASRLLTPTTPRLVMPSPAGTLTHAHARRGVKRIHRWGDGMWDSIEAVRSSLSDNTRSIWNSRSEGGGEDEDGGRESEDRGDTSQAFKAPAAPNTAPLAPSLATWGQLDEGRLGADDNEKARKFKGHSV